MFRDDPYSPGLETWRKGLFVSDSKAFLFVPLNLSILKKKFVLMEKTKMGREIFRPIRIEKAGLCYDITKWYVPKQAITGK
jgi:hypothetical protein